MIFTLVVYAGVLGKKTSNPDAQYILPPLFETTQPFEYLARLASLETIDFQPVRDLSLFLDISFFRMNATITFATFNAIFLGILACLMMALLKRISPEKKHDMPFYWALVFASHPLLSQSVGWGMARKHILAALFVLWATILFLEWKEGKKHWLYFFIAYVTSVLSHPVAILWPLWAFIHLRATRTVITKETKKIFSLVIISMILLFMINFTYYKIGHPVHADVYPRFSTSLTDARAMISNFTFDLTQIFYPFRLAFVYYPDFSVSWPGFIIIALIGAILIIRKNCQLLSWVIFSFLTIPMSVTLPGVYDSYLILPCAGMMIILYLMIDFHSPWTKSLLVGTAVALGVFTHFEARKWTDEVIINARNFENAKTCQTAMNFAMASYGKGKKVPVGLISYIRANSCFDIAVQFPPASRRIFLYIESMMLFYEDGAFPYEERVSRLRFLGERHYFPRLVYAALLATENKATEVEENARFVLDMVRGPIPVSASVIDQVLRPYCEINRLPACLEVTNSEPTPGYL